MFDFKSKKIGFLWIVIILTGLIFCEYTSFVGWGETKTGNIKNIFLDMDLKGGINVVYKSKNTTISTEDFQKIKEKLDARAKIFSPEAKTYIDDNNHIVINIPQQTDADKVLNKLSSEGKLLFACRSDNIKKETTKTTEEITEKEPENILKNKTVWLRGSDIADAQGLAITNNLNGAENYIVEITFNEKGITKFEKLTTKKVGKPLFIIYNDEILASPIINEPVKNGKFQISGMKSLEEAQELASMIRIGSFEYELEEISHKVIDSKLETMNFTRILFVGIIGLVVICLFMITTYKLLGFISIISLAFYLLLTLESFNFMDTILNIPGLTCLLVSFCLNLYSYIIILGKINEEIMETQKDTRSCIELGFQKASDIVVNCDLVTLFISLLILGLSSNTIYDFQQLIAIPVYTIILSIFSSFVLMKILMRVLYVFGLINKDTKQLKRKAYMIEEI